MKRIILGCVIALASFTAPLFAGEKCVALMASSPQAGGNEASTFSVTQILDIELTAMFPKSAANKLIGLHVAEIRIYTPKHSLYQSISLPFSADAKRKGEKHRLQNYPELVPLRVLRDLSGSGKPYLGLTASLPVAGTPILMNSMYGTWSAEAFLDGEPFACSPSVKFAINQ
ncbi:MAG TPA: hypothetical protein VHL58_04305 [Thermoanaerobaculia bacterium]|nr:hypothetical protein [Thermoanaerobaculia bacterium]